MSTKNSLPPRRKASMPIQPKKNTVSFSAGINDEFLHTRKESYLNSQFNMRQNKLKEISKENKQIYSRLNSQKSVYSSQDLNKSYEMKKGLSSSKMSQRSNNSRVSDRSKNSSKSIGRGQKPLIKKKDIKVDIKTTSINNVR